LNRDCLNGKILRINLSTGKISKELALSYIKKFLGGRGVNHWLLLKEMKPKILPFDPESLLLFGTGTLVGTPAPGAIRLNIAGKSPLTGGIGSGSACGDFAPELRFAGYDHIIITGKARKPCYIWINDDQVQIRDASHLWGKSTWETETLIRKELADDSIQVATIGPAGENLVKFSCIIVSPARVVARCGLGALMGSKNLKAIAVKGTGKIKIKKKDKFNQIVKEILKKIQSSETLQRTKKYGTIKAFSPNLSTKNYQDAYINPEDAKKLHYKEVFQDKYEKENYHCFNCPIKCGRIYEVTDGIYSGAKSRKLEANSFSDFASRLCIYYAPAIVKLHGLCDQYGLDIDSTSGVIAWAMECYQRGILSKKDVDGLELRWGNHQAAVKLIRKIAYREGIGDILAEGCKRASKVIGAHSNRYCIEIKGQEVEETIRPFKAWALGVVVSERGGGHTRGAPLTDLKGISPEMGEKMWGVPAASDPTVYNGKAKIVVYYERFHSVLDSLGVCYLISNWEDLVLPGPEDYASLLSIATGLDISSKNLMRVGEQIHIIGKAFNIIHANFCRKDDYPPIRLIEEPMKAGPFKGQRLEINKWDKMLDEYYELHHWDKETGWCTKESLKSLNLTEVEDVLKEAGKLQG